MTKLNRRAFLGTVGAAVVAARPAFAKSVKKVGMQLYTVRTDLEKDFEAKQLEFKRRYEDFQRDLKRTDAELTSGIVEQLYIYWRPGMAPPSLEELTGPGEEPSSGGGDAVAAAGEGGGDALSEAAKRVPPHLLERSRAALAKWKANH